MCSYPTPRRRSEVKAIRRSRTLRPCALLGRRESRLIPLSFELLLVESLLINLRVHDRFIHPSERGLRRQCDRHSEQNHDHSAQDRSSVTYTRGFEKDCEPACRPEPTNACKVDN